MKKLFFVRIETDVVVYADSPTDAEDEAEHVLHRGDLDFDFSATEVTKQTQLYEWGACRPYGKTDDVVGQTCREILARILREQELVANAKAIHNQNMKLFPEE